MSAAAALQAGAVAALQGAGVGAVFDHPPAGAGLPHVQVEEPVLVDWGAKQLTGREARLTVRVHDRGERPERLRTLMAAAEAAVVAMPPALDGGWRVASLVFVRGGGRRAGDGRWTGSAEFRVRMWRD